MQQTPRARILLADSKRLAELSAKVVRGEGGDANAAV